MFEKLAEDIYVATLEKLAKYSDITFDKYAEYHDLIEKVAKIIPGNMKPVFDFFAKQPTKFINNWLQGIKTNKIPFKTSATLWYNHPQIANTARRLGHGPLLESIHNNAAYRQGRPVSIKW